jgi:hypothetical protein
VTGAAAWHAYPEFRRCGEISPLRDGQNRRPSGRNDKFWVAADVENPNFGIQAYWKATFLHPTGVRWRIMLTAAVGQNHELGGNAPSC